MAINFLNKLDAGAFGDVWRATDSLERQVAVKIIRSAGVGVSDALDHAKALARASHPNVVTVFTVEKACDPDTGVPVDCVVMELIVGHTLAERLRGRAFTAQEVREFGFGAIDGLAHIHSQGLTHGDLHNGNVMIDGTKIKIIDILYLDSLAALSTASRQEKTRRDLVCLRLILQDLIFYSELDPAELTEFNNLLHASSDIDAIRKAFDAVTDPETIRNEQRLLDHCYKRATDDNFVEGDEYASALMDETPRSVVMPLLKRMIEDRSFQKRHKSYVRALWSALNKEEVSDLIDVINGRLEEDTPNGKWSPNLRFVARLRDEIWHRLSRPLQIKLERMIVNDLLSGRYDLFGGGTRAGVLGTYVTSLWPVFTDRAKIIDNIESLLCQSWYTQNYVGNNLLEVLPQLVQTPSDRARLISGLATAIRNDAKIVKNRLSELPDDWVKAINEKVRG